MQARGQNLIDAATQQFAVQPTRSAQALAALPVGDQIQVRDHAVHARGQRARHGRAQDRQFSHLVRGE